MIEGKDYELVMPEDEGEYWACRILTGDFVETVIKFGAISLNESEDALNFNFYVVSSPDTNANIDNHELYNIFMNTCLTEGHFELRDRETGEDLPYDEVFRNVEE